LTDYYDEARAIALQMERLITSPSTREQQIRPGISDDLTRG
jgi:hypothetical protein